MPTSAPCSMSITDGIALILMHHAPVNALSRPLRDQLYEYLHACADTDAVKAVVLTSTELPFSAGADIKEFAGPMQGKFFLDFFDVISKLKKPLISGINQYALGGGLELAMLGHYRVLQKNARVGLPEVKLGLIPGGTGTMSLPRLVGVEKAMSMITSGQPMTAQEALAAGLADAVVDDVLQGALDFARQILHAGTVATLPLLRPQPTVPGVDFFANQRVQLQKKYPSFPAPLRALDCLEASCHQSLQDGLAFETKTFMQLITGPDCAGMRYAFLSERMTGHVPGIQKENALSVEMVGIVGGGLMGSGIAIAFLRRGFQVRILEVDTKRVQVCQSHIDKHWKMLVSKGKTQQEEAQKFLDALHVSTDISALSNCQLVIEAVFENMDLKKDLMQKLDQACHPDTILATNTSGLNVNQLAAVTKRPEKVLGLHFFSPAHVMKLIEIVRAEHTDPTTLATGLAIAKRLKKVAVVVGVCPGFVGNRMIFRYFEQVIWLLLRGCSPTQIDTAMTNFGFAMGPCQMADMSGLEIWVHANPEKDSLIHDLVAHGRLGQKNGQGFYDYQGGSHRPHASEEAQRLITAFSKNKDLPTQTWADEAIVDRLLCALINEGAHCLEEKKVMRASDIDVIYVHGYGFPIYRGGPMFYANHVGLENIVKKIDAYHKDDPQSWPRSSLLQTLRDSGKNFSSC